jgi:ACT domain-containing protein
VDVSGGVGTGEIHVKLIISTIKKRKMSNMYYYKYKRMVRNADG